MVFGVMLVILGLIRHPEYQPLKQFVPISSSLEF